MKIVTALSGGVDSGTCALLLLREGFEELEYFAIDWILELCKPNLRYSLRLQGRDNQYIDVAFRIKKI